MTDMATGRSQTVIIHIINKTPIEWYSKLQSCVETSTYISEYAAARICTSHIGELLNTLLYLGVTLHMVN